MSAFSYCYGLAILVFMWNVPSDYAIDRFGERLVGGWKKEWFKNGIEPSPPLTAFASTFFGHSPPIPPHEGTRTRERPPPVKTTRVYYIAAIEVEWDYAPRGNQIGEKGDEFVDFYFEKGYNPVRLGKSYKKAVFREFTDETYSVLKRRQAWQGILGPTIQGEVGDLAIIHFRNNASMPLSMHPHGARYIKVHEGALYEDNTGPEDKIDDRVPPGGSHTYNWYFIPKDGPTPTDPDCLTWMYHSHRNADTDIHAGLLGPIIVCRPGTLDRFDQPRNVDRWFALVFLIFDENDSFYIDENIERHVPGITVAEREALKMDPEFRRSNMMFSINGLGWSNLQGLDMCLGERVGWHIVGMGNEVDVHTISFSGQILTINGRTSDTIALFPAKFTTSLMITSRPGTFRTTCEVGIHSNAGMEAEFTISECPDSRRIKQRLNGKVREFFLAAEEVEWNYAPSGINRFNGQELTRDKAGRVFFTRNGTRIGGEYRKVVYREYTDETFKRKKPRTFEETHLALLGPTLRAEVGDLVKIVFMNKATLPFNVQTRGAFYEPNDDPVEPGKIRVYNWVIAEQYGPTQVDPQCITFPYYSNVDVLRDRWSGLIGTFLTCKPGSLDEEGKQKNIDREFALFFTVMDEMESHYLEENIMEYTSRPRLVNVSDPEFIESNQLHAINGRVFGNLEGLSMCLGEKISWHITAFGKQIDMHTPYFHGQTFQIGGRFKDTISLTPSTHYTVVMHTDNPGDWALDCRTNDHFANGMRAVFRVEDCHGSFGFPNSIFFNEPKKVREYFIAAVEEDWNYAPTDVNIIDGEPLLSIPEGRFYLQNGPDRIGRIYKKALYREYTDASFLRRKPVTEENEHLAMIGPFIRAEVGEMIRVVFKNMASRPYNMHPHGVILDRTHDFAFQDHVDEDEGPVQPGDTQVYEWLVPERAGPGRTGFNCTSWAYYSTVDVVRDTSAGLMGPLVTCKPGILTPANKRIDVDHEFAVLWTISDENLSWYLKENIARFTTRPQSVDEDDEQFQMSNRMHGVNGRTFGSLRGLVANRNTHASWHLIGMGTEVDMHTAHFHGQTFLKRTDSARRGDVVYLFPGVFETVEMFMDNPGTWFLHCHVDDHMRAGMSATYTVRRT